jgi:two-component system, NtrC family, response regulator HydG
MPPDRGAEENVRVLVVDDDLALAETLADGLQERGYVAFPEGSSTTAAERLERESIHALVTDLRMPGPDGLQLLALSRRLDPMRPVIVTTAFSDVASAVESIRQGAYHYLTKPFKVDELELFLRRAVAESRLRSEAVVLRRALRDRFALANLVGKSASMRALLDLVERVADAEVPILLAGETGTGKGLVARALHGLCRRSAGPFISVNCAALPENLLESELFGHVKGAFTGATSQRPGLFEEADGGTLFLDEIGEIDFSLQAKLLDVLESGLVRAVGSNKQRPVDVRVIAASNRNLREMAASHRFREDLLFRLDVVRLELPALRDRLEDLPALVQHFLQAAKRRHTTSPVERFSPEAHARLAEHSWPGNVRELENLVERAVLLGRTVEVQAEDLRLEQPQGLEGGRVEFRGPVLPLRELQRRYASWALQQEGGRRLATAEALGVDRKTLAKLLEASDEGEEEVKPPADGSSQSEH